MTENPTNSLYFFYNNRYTNKIGKRKITKLLAKTAIIKLKNNKAWFFQDFFLLLLNNKRKTIKLKNCQLITPNLPAPSNVTIRKSNQR